jgi:hypothetical protein
VSVRGLVPVQGRGPAASEELHYREVPQMTQQELRDQLWQELPLIRRNIIGREKVDDIITIAIEQCPLEFIQHISEGSAEKEIVTAAWGQSVKRGYDLLYGEDATFGPLIWILLSPVIQYLIKRLLEWWFESRTNRVLMAGWRRELTK